MLNLIFFYFFTILVSLLAGIILAYISMAAAIGPWTSPGIILICNAFLFSTQHINKQRNNNLALLLQAGASLTALMATAIGFCLPTLYFLSPNDFYQLIASPLKFSFWLGLVSLASAILGSLSILVLGKEILFAANTGPVSKFFINTHEQSQLNAPTASIAAGAGFSSLLLLAREGLFKFKTFAPLSWLASFAIKPMMWAVGYSLGLKIAIPLIVGISLQKLIIWPTTNFPWLQNRLFGGADVLSIGAAFCSGILLFELLFPLFFPSFYQQLWRTILAWRPKNQLTAMFFKQTGWPLLFLSAIFMLLVLKALNFSLLASSAIIFGTIICSLEIAKFVNNYGLAPFGRFATFVMLPCLALFDLSSGQTTWLCIVVTVACAAAANLAIQAGIQNLARLRNNELINQHWQSLALASILLGGIFWLLFNQLPLGGSALFAQRGQMRALLINSKNFPITAILLGAGIGGVLHRLKIPLMMVFGGFLMPYDLSAALLLGASINYLLPKSAAHENFWTGVFASEAVLVTIFLLFRLVGNL